MVSLFKLREKRLAFTFLVCAAFCIGASGGDVFAQKKGDAPSEYKIKAVLLGKLFRYIKFPKHSPQNGPYTILIIGKDPQDEFLKQVKDMEFNNRRVETKRIRKFKKGETPIENCHILFISRDERRNTEDIVAAAPDFALTISEYPGFIEDDGGMINLVIGKDKRLKMEFNQQNTSEAGIRIPANILRRSPKVIRKRTD